MRDDNGQNEGRGCDEITTSDNEIVSADRYGKDFEPVFNIGPWWLIVLVYGALVAATLVYYAYYGDHSQGHTPAPRSEAVQQHSHEHGSHAGAATDLQLASELNWGWNISFLEHGNKDDSKMRIHDGALDGMNGAVLAWGCDRYWTKVDKNGVQAGNGIRETNCNLVWHKSGRMTPSGPDWSSDTSWHRD